MLCQLHADDVKLLCHHGTLLPMQISSGSTGTDLQFMHLAQQEVHILSILWQRSLILLLLQLQGVLELDVVPVLTLPGGDDLFKLLLRYGPNTAEGLTKWVIQLCTPRGSSHPSL